jgi:hypothetical protein
MVIDEWVMVRVGVGQPIANSQQQFIASDKNFITFAISF